MATDDSIRPKRKSNWLFTIVAVLGMLGVMAYFFIDNSVKPVNSDTIVDKAEKAPIPAKDVVSDHWSKVILKQGDSVNYPNIGDRIKMDYTGSLLDGSIFDSSKGRFPIEGVIGVGRFIRGWDEGVITMSLGERAKLTISPEYAYGQRGYSSIIPPNSTLIFEMELLGIN